MYRFHIYALQQRASVMTELFETEIGALVSHYSKKKKGAPVKKNKNIVVRLNSINADIKKRVLSLYLCRMKFYFTVKTIKWFLIYRHDNYTDEAMTDLMETLDKRAHQLFEIDQVLFDVKQHPNY